MRIGPTPRAWKLLGRTVDRIATLRVLLIVTFRPEFEPPWIGRPHVTALTINRLAQRDIDAMIDRVVGNKLLPASIRQDIIERTDGIPLFVEEMTKAVLEAESEGEARADRRRGSVSGAGGPRKLARLADGAARPARPRQGGGADRGGDRAGVLPCPAGCGGAQAGGGAGIGARPSHCGWFAVPAGRAAACDLSVQACPGAGRGLWHAAARAATRASCPHRRNPRKPIRGDRREPAGAAGASLHRGRPDREGRGPVGQGGTAVAGALGAGRSRRAAHARARPDRGLARHARAASRADQASGRAHNPTHACQRVCCAGNQGGCGAGTSADRTSRSARRASRRPAAVVLGPLRLLGRELRGVQRRR